MDTLATSRIARRLARLALAVAFLGAAPATAQALRWDVDVAPDGEIFPVLDLSQARAAAKDAAGDGSGLVAVRVTTDVPRELHLTVETAQRLGVESAMRRISQSAIAEEVLAAYLSRWQLPAVAESNRLDAG